MLTFMPSRTEGGGRRPGLSTGGGYVCEYEVFSSVWLHSELDLGRLRMYCLFSTSRLTILSIAQGELRRRP